MTDLRVTISDNDDDVTPKKSFLERYRTSKMPGLMVVPLVALAIVAVCFALIGPVYVVFRRNSASDDSAAKLSTVCVSADNVVQPFDKIQEGIFGGTESYLVASVSAYQMTAATNMVRYTVEFDGSGEFRKYQATHNDVAVPRGEKLYVQLGKSFQQYTLSAQLPRMDVGVVVDPESPASSYVFYPFDSYNFELVFGAYLEANLSTGGSTRKAVPICLYFYNTLALYDIKSVEYESASTQDFAANGTPDFVANGTANIVVANIVIARTTATKFFSIFIVILMWGLSASVMALTLDLLFVRPREPAPPVVGFCVAFLFAMPSLRNVQPDVPVIGAAVDVLGFFWNMSMIAISVMMLAAAMAGYHKYKPM